MLRVFIISICVAAWCAARAEPSAQAQLRVARASLDAGNAEEAFAECQAVLEAFDDPATRNRAFAGQARARFEQGRFAESARLFQRAADGAEETPEWQAEWLSRAADAVFASGQFAEAARMYRQVYTLFPENKISGEMLLRAADALARGGDTQTAFETFARAAEADPALAAEARVRQAEFMAPQGEVAACAALVEQVLASEEKTALRGRALLAMGRAHFAANEFEEALAVFESAAKIAEIADEAAWLRVPVLYGLARVDDARFTAEKLAWHDDATATFAQDARFWLIRHAFNNERFDEVAKLVDFFVNASPHDPRAETVLVWSARAAVLAENFQRAVDDISRLRKMFPNSELLSEGVFVQGVALLKLGRFQEAVMVFDDLVTRFPESAWTTAAWLRKGDAFYLLGAAQDANFNSAIAAYEEATLRHDITPSERFEALYKIGRSLEHLNRASDALSVYTENIIAPFLECGSEERASALGWNTHAVFRAANIMVLKNLTGD